MPQEKSKSALDREISIGGVSDVDILLFTKHLSVTLKSGLTLTEGLEILSEQAKGKMKNVAGDILQTVEGGASFHEALEKYPKYFSPIYVNMVKSGEVSGTLEENLNRLGIQLNKAHALRKKIKAAMIYPMMVLIAVFGLGMSVAIFILPKILPLFKSLDVDLPLSTRILISIAETFEAHGLAMFMGMIAGSIFLTWFLKRDFVKPFSHRVFLATPVFSTIIRNINLERFTRTFGTLLTSGLTVDQSLEITASSTENRVYRSAVKKLIPEIQRGNTLAQAMLKNDKVFPPITRRMIGMGEKTGNLDNTLEYLSKFYQEEVDEATKNLSTIIEPALLMFIGLLVGFVAISILGPIYQITGSLRG